VDEVRRVRDAHAAIFNYDLDAIFQDIKEQEKKSGLKFVSYPPRKTEPNLYMVSKVKRAHPERGLNNSVCFRLRVA
jgi:hypothetical protein